VEYKRRENSYFYFCIGLKHKFQFPTHLNWPDMDCYPILELEVFGETVNDRTERKSRLYCVFTSFLYIFEKCNIAIKVKEI